MLPTSFGDPGPAIEAFAGTIGRERDDGPVGQDTLFQMGSTSKSFAAAVILKLEAAGLLSLDDTVGKWLPEYSAWEEVTLRRLLNMTSGIPNYSETETLSRIWTNQPTRELSPEELIDAVYPSGSNQLPTSTGYHYSNTNYILAAEIASRAAGKSYRDLVYERVHADPGEPCGGLEKPGRIGCASAARRGIGARPLGLRTGPGNETFCTHRSLDGTAGGNAAPE